jgi:proteic killer suppression protein
LRNITSGVILEAVRIKDQGTQDLFDRKATKAARAVVPPSIVRVALRKLTLVNVAASLDDLRVPPGNRLEALKGDRAGQHAIRINDQYRVCFKWAGTEAVDVEIVDYH